MIDVTKLDGKEITVNAELIEYIEEIPETLYLAPVNDEGTADMTRAIRLV